MLVVVCLLMFVRCYARVVVGFCLKICVVCCLLLLLVDRSCVSVGGCLLFVFDLLFVFCCLSFVCLMLMCGVCCSLCVVCCV